MTQVLLCKSKDLTSGPHHTHKSELWKCSSPLPAIEFLGLAGQPLWPIDELQVQWETLPLKHKVEGDHENKRTDVNLCPPHTHTRTYTLKQTQTSSTSTSMYLLLVRQVVEKVRRLCSQFSGKDCAQVTCEQRYMACLSQDSKWC